MPSIEQQVRERAYHIWEGEGRVFGQAVDHWLRAEAELRDIDMAAAEELLVVRPSTPATGDAKSPAKTLKPRSARNASVAAAAVAAKAESKPAKSAAAKKPAATKPRTKAASGGNAGAGVVLH